MARRVMVTRPEAEALSTAEALARRGCETVIAPMLSIVATGVTVGDAARFQAAIATSGNGADGLAAATSRRALPVYAVGEATAERLRAHGFAPVRAAEGTASWLMDLLQRELHAERGPLLWASGEEVRVDLAAGLGGQGFDIHRIVTYRAVPADALPAAAADALTGGTVDAILFFSPRTAERFASLVTGAGLARSTAAITACCLSPAVADAARALPWASVRTASRTTQDDLLATLDDTMASDPD